MDLLKFQLHLFDLDDTLINTKAAYRFAQETAIKNYYDDLPSDILNSTFPSLHLLCQEFGSGKVESYLSAFLDAYPKIFPKKEDTVERLLQIYYRTFYNTLTCFEGCIAFLKTLKNAGKTVALVTNGLSESQNKKLELTGLSSFFTNSQRYISADFKPDEKKPSPFMIRKAFQDSNTRPSDVAFYGNSVGDMIAGKLAGVSCIHVAASTPLPEKIAEVSKPVWTIPNWTFALDALR